MADQSAGRQRGNEAGPVAAAVAESVAERRQELGWTRRELADRMSAAGRRFTPEAIQKLEAGGRRIDVDDAATLATVLDIAVTELLSLGQAQHRSTVRDLIGFERRNPLVLKAIHLAVVENNEPRPLVLDYVDHAARMIPRVIQFDAEYQEWVAAVRGAADDTAAAEAFLSGWPISDAGVGVPSADEIAAVVGPERAEAVRAAIVERASDGER